MNLLTVVAAAVIGGLLLSFLFISIYLPRNQDYPYWVIEAFEEFEKEAEEDQKLTPIERLLKYFPDAEVTQEGNTTVVELLPK